MFTGLFFLCLNRTFVHAKGLFSVFTGPFRVCVRFLGVARTQYCVQRSLLSFQKALSSVVRPVLSVYRTLVCVQRAILSVQRALWSVYRALLSVVRTLLHVKKNLVRVQKALLSVYRALLSVYTTLLSVQRECDMTHPCMGHDFSICAT